MPAATTSTTSPSRSPTARLTDTQAIAVTVTNVNDNAPVITRTAAAPRRRSTSPRTPPPSRRSRPPTPMPGQTLTYSIVGGADAAQFTIDPTPARLSFVSAPDYENPTDAGAQQCLRRHCPGLRRHPDRHPGHRRHRHQRQRQCAGDHLRTAAGATASRQRRREQHGRDDGHGRPMPMPDRRSTYSIVGGADAAQFTIDATTGALSFVAAPDYENPTDAGGNNVYDVTVQVSDGTLTDTQAIAVTVTNGQRQCAGRSPPTAAAPRRRSTSPRTRPRSPRSPRPTPTAGSDADLLDHRRRGCGAVHDRLQRPAR